MNGRSAASARSGFWREQGGLRHGLMACGLGKMLLPGRWLLRLARFGRLPSIARLLFALLWVAGLLFTLLRVAGLLPLTLTLARRLMAIACSCSCGTRPAVSSLSVCLAWRARGFGGKVGGRHEAVYRNHRDLAFDQPLDVPEKL